MDQDKKNALREMLASQKMRSAWSRLDVTDYADRVAAFEGVRRLLAKDGLKLADVLDAVLDQASAAKFDHGPSRTSPESDRASRAQAEAAKSREAARQEAARSQEARRAEETRRAEEAMRTARPEPPRRHPVGRNKVTGKAIPAVVRGRVCNTHVLGGDRGSVVFSISEGDDLYGPMIVHDETMIEMITTAHLQNARISADVRPVGVPEGMAVVDRVRVGMMV
jgi:hypothetical protein